MINFGSWRRVTRDGNASKFLDLAHSEPGATPSLSLKFRFKPDPDRLFIYEPGSLRSGLESNSERILVTIVTIERGFESITQKVDFKRNFSDSFTAH